MKQVIHAPGTFCWAELATNDAVGAKKFYSELMGWKMHDDPIPGGGTYTMIQLEDGNVGAMFELSDDMGGKDTPPNWLSYVSVEDASATAAKAKEMGATLLKDAFDVMDIGRMAVIQDPTGAIFAVWQPIKTPGTDFTGGKPFTMCWNELMTRDTARAEKFYTSVFPWKPTPMEKSPTPYTIFKNGEAMAGGMMEIPAEMGEVPPHWMIYFAVDDCDKISKKATSLGAKTLGPPSDIPNMGRFSVLQDPQGAAFSIFQSSS